MAHWRRQISPTRACLALQALKRRLQVRDSLQNHRLRPNLGASRLGPRRCFFWQLAPRHLAPLPTWTPPSATMAPSGAGAVTLESFAAVRGRCVGAHSASLRSHLTLSFATRMEAQLRLSTARCTGGARTDSLVEAAVVGAPLARAMAAAPSSPWERRLRRRRCRGQERTTRGRGGVWLDAGRRRPAAAMATAGLRGGDGSIQSALPPAPRGSRDTGMPQSPIWPGATRGDGHGF